MECVKPLEDTDHVLFLFIVRDVDSWISAMHKNPHHALNHRGLNMFKFVKTPWVSFTRKRANVLWKQQRNDHYLIEKSANIVTLRNEKNEHFYGLKDKVKHFALIRSNFVRKDLMEVGKRFNIDILDEFPTFRKSDYPPLGPRVKSFIGKHLDNTVDNNFSLK